MSFMSSQELAAECTNESDMHVSPNTKNNTEKRNIGQKYQPIVVLVYL